MALTELVQSSPPWVHTLFAIGYAMSLIYGLVIIGVLIFGGPDRRSALRDVLLVVVVAGALTVLLSLFINRAWPYVLPEIDLKDSVPRFPVTRVAVVTSILVVVAPFVTRPLRRLGWLVIVTTAVASIALSYGAPSHTIGSFGLGLLSAGLLLALVGTPRGYPEPETVAAALAALGVPIRELETAPYQTWGVVRFVATGADGGPVDVKVHGRDALDSQLAAKAWHTLRYRATGRAVSFSRLQAVEHEALVTVMAAQAGVRVPQLAAVGSPSEEICLISFREFGQPFTEIEPGRITDDQLVRVWSEVRLLHQQSISHGSLGLDAIHIGEDGPIITDFVLGSLALDDSDQGSDVVELLFSLAALVGGERAIRTAMEGLGQERLVAALPYLQLPAVSPPTRRLVDKPKVLMADLTSTMSDITGAEMPDPVKLRRVSVRNLVTAVVLLLVALALFGALTSVDYSEIWSVLQSANWTMIVFALLVGHTQFVPSATATMFAVPARLPFGPLLTLQTASQFISLAIPSAAGRVAMNAAFIHKFGVSVTVAVAQGAVDGFSGFLVQIAIMILILLVGDASLDVGINTSDVRWGLILLVILLLVVLVVMAVLRIKRLRERVLPIVSEAWGALSLVLRQPTRAIGLLASNFIYWNVLGLTLWILLVAVGVDISYGSALFVAAGTSLLAGFMPVPGGVGVAEATMVALLVTMGVDQSSAFAVTAVYRVITFYLPAVEGFFGTRWLEHNGYI
jgi:glycosyltransferase 2 family protein